MASVDPHDAMTDPALRERAALDILNRLPDAWRARRDELRSGHPALVDYGAISAHGPEDSPA